GVPHLAGGHLWDGVRPRRSPCSRWAGSASLCSARACPPATRPSDRLPSKVTQGGIWLAGSLLPSYHDCEDSHGCPVMTSGKEGRMQNDEPTLPHRVGFASDDAADPDIYPEAPTWPPVGERSAGLPGPDRSPLLWLSLGATGVAVLGLLAVLLLNQLGVFASLGAPGPLGPFVPTTAPSSPTATSPATAPARAPP